MSARAAARTEWVNDRARALVESGFSPADARAQAEREFDVADSVDFKTRGLASGDLRYNERRELVDRRGRRVFDRAVDDRRQRLDPDVDERDPEDDGDPNAVTAATLQREVRVQGHGGHGSGRRRHKKAPKPDAIEMARYQEVKRSIRGSAAAAETLAERRYREYYEQHAREHRPGAPLKGREPRTRFLGRIEPSVAKELEAKTGLSATDLLRELHCLSLMAGDSRTALFALERLETMFIGYAISGADELTGT